MEQSSQQPNRHTKRRTLLVPYATCLTARLAHLVRDRSRRIRTMRFRPANIRLINRRESHLGCCLVCSNESYLNETHQCC
jgi:hypothetical protein